MSKEIASSKSFASSGSIVKVNLLVWSSLYFSFSISFFIQFVSCSTLSEKTYGRENPDLIKEIPRIREAFDSVYRKYNLTKLSTEVPDIKTGD